jgi:hypothetical protein
MSRVTFFEPDKLIIMQKAYDTIITPKDNEQLKEAAAKYIIKLAENGYTEYNDLTAITTKWMQRLKSKSKNYH